MFTWLYLFTLFVVGNCGKRGFSTRIVNGTRATLGEFPYIVSIQMKGHHNCGGSIIDADHVLTAAHCLDGYERFEFFIQHGVVDLNDTSNRIRVADRMFHSGFNKSHGFFDIAILTLEDSIQFDDYTQPARFPEEWALTPEGESAVLAGWGLDYTGANSTDRYLEKVHLEVFLDEDCEETYNGTMKTNSDIQLCAGAKQGGKGQCSGDSGGPLYSEGVQIGVVSWSIKPCGHVGLPGVYTKVSMYIRWINDHTGNAIARVNKIHVLS